jgi:N-acetylglucosaminyldiphosphoundecaprenol N-acetyl-beta-D-mannosaminyltransferase
MAENWDALRPAVLMGVGAAFDFHADKVARAPEWMRKVSLEWLYRLYKEPRRLWKRYLVTNSLFVYHLIRDATMSKP